MRIWKLKLDREDVISHWITTVEGKVVLIPMEASGSEKMAFHAELQIEPKYKELFEKHKKNVPELKNELLAIINEETKKEMDSYVDRAPK